MNATFGDLDRLADAALQDAGRLLRTGGDPAGLPAALAAVIRPLRRLAAGALPYGPEHPEADPLWAGAADRLDTALAAAARSLRGVPPAARPGPAAGRLLRAADLLGGAGDLLAGHVVLTAAGPSDRDDLAAVLAGAPARRGLLLLTGGHAGRLAELAALAAGRGGPDASRLGRVAGLLDEAADRLRTVGWLDPPAGSGLAGVPAVAPLRRQPVGPAEPAGLLLARAVADAEQLVTLAFRAHERRILDGHPAAGLAVAATGQAIVAHTTAGLLHRAAPDLAEAGPPADRIRSLAGRAASGADGWVGVRQAWRGLRDAVPAGPPPVQLTSEDLALRVGRIAYGPAWTPRVGADRQPRPIAELADATGGLPALLAGLHRLTVAAALLAREHGSLADRAARAGRLYVPTASLPSSVDVPRAWAPAPRRDTARLAGAYRHAGRCCQQTAGGLAEHLLRLPDLPEPLAAGIRLGQARLRAPITTAMLGCPADRDADRAFEPAGLLADP